MSRVIPRTVLAAVVGAAAATGIVVAVAPRSSTPRSAPTTTLGQKATTTIAARTSGLTASQVYQRDSAGVVAIQATSPGQQDSGTGVVLSSDGYIVTNDHVISGASSVSVSTGSNSSSTASSSSGRTAQVVGEDPNSDLAVIKVDPTGLNLHPLTLAQSSTVGVGDPVYAIGNPYGLDQTLTRGIVSALNRQISAPDGTAINGAIQTDAALNPGNSGGPLIDSHGDVIGINSQIASEASSAGGQPGSTGVGFAIASDTVKSVVAQIESTHAGAIQSPSQQTQQQQVQIPGGGASPTDPYGNGDPYGGADPYGYGGGGYGAGGYGAGGGGGVVVVP